MVQVKMRASWLALIGLFVAMLVSWSLTVAPVAAASSMPFGKGRLFEVSMPGTPPNYVFGTMHVADKEVLKLPAPIARAFKGSRLVLVENDGDPAEMTTILQAMLLPKGHTLKDLLKPALYAEVVTAGEAMGLNESKVNRLRPWALAFMLGDPGDRNARQASGQPVLDDALQRYAAKRGVPVAALDRANEIANLFTIQLSDAEQALMLEDLLHDPVPVADRIEAIRTAYLAGDLDIMMQSFHMNDPAMSDAKRRFAKKFLLGLLTDRNQRWIPRMASHLKSGGVFVAVGAAHLPGEEGILRLLEKAGYRVERVL